MAAVLSVTPSPTAPAAAMDNWVSAAFAQGIKIAIINAGRMTKPGNRCEKDSMDMGLLYTFGNF
jgi:hypothetical protein